MDEAVHGHRSPVLLHLELEQVWLSVGSLAVQNQLTDTEGQLDFFISIFSDVLFEHPFMDLF